MFFEMFQRTRNIQHTIFNESASFQFPSRFILNSLNFFFPPDKLAKFDNNSIDCISSSVPDLTREYTHKVTDRSISLYVDEITNTKYAPNTDVEMVDQKNDSEYIVM
jgi:hypothetical protein